MKTAKRITFLLIIATCFAACHKNSSVHPENIDTTGRNIQPPTAEEFSQQEKQGLESQMQAFSLDLDTLSKNFIEWTSEKGTHLKIYTGTLSKDGNPVEGDVTIQFLELYNAGEMLVTNKTTMGLDDDGNLVPIITGGAFYINILKDGTPIDTMGHITLTVNGNLTGGVDDDMILWHGNTDDDGNLTWVTIGMQDQKARLDTKDTTYSAVFNSFGWTNIDKFASYNGPKTKLEVKAPDGFDNTNSLIYLKYKGEPNALARLDKYEENKGLFTEHYGWLPIGEECHLIFASARSDGKWLIAIKDNLTIEDNKTYVFTDEETQIVDTNEDVIALIDALP